MQAETFRGYGIQFEYPDVYEVTIKEKKNSTLIKLRHGSNAIEIKIKPNRFELGFPESIAKSILQALKNTYEVTDIVVNKDKKIPLKIKGIEEEVEVDTLKYRFSLTFTNDKLNIKLYQSLYLFSYARSGYIVTFTRATEDYSDMIKVLSTFHFDEAEKAMITEEESRY